MVLACVEGGEGGGRGGDDWCRSWQRRCDGVSAYVRIEVPTGRGAT